MIRLINQDCLDGIASVLKQIDSQLERNDIQNYLDDRSQAYAKIFREECAK